MTYLNFVTLNTGAVERTFDPGGSAVDPAALDLARALRDGSSPISGRQGYTIKALPAGRALVCTTYGPAGQPLATFGIARRSVDAAKLWDMLHASSPNYNLRTDPAKPPTVPWCAVRVEPSLLSDPEAAQWLATYELEIAWAWVNRRHRDA